MKRLLRPLLLPLAAAAAASTASAATLPFSARYDGVAQVVEVVNPDGPVLRFEITSAGSGSFDLGGYFSSDVIDMSTGAGTGSSRFVAGNGDQLFGSAEVHAIPTSVPSIIELIGQTTFSGGTGLFSGASGSATFVGRGEFTSATSGLSSLTYTGSIALVPEPGSWLLLSIGVAALVLRRAAL